MKNKSLVVFDFDGTLTIKDTFLELIKYYKGIPAFYWGLIMLSPILLLYLGKIIPNWRAKEHVLSYFFKGMHIDDFQSLCDDFSSKCIPKLLREEALFKLNWHKSKNHDIVIVSASAENWLKIWCSNNGVSLIATKLEIKNNYITGSLCGKNCYGMEKLAQLKEQYDLDHYDEIYVYGDSRGDKEILSIAKYPFYRRF